MTSETRQQSGAILRPLLARDQHEHHRAATPLELLYDLVLVISVGAAAAGLHHAINENHIGEGIFIFLFVFWTLWWPWVNFTWFASAFDNDDAGYRLLVFVQMVGALMTAVGIKDLNNNVLTILPLAGYILMRVGMISLWLRAARANPAHANCARRYALGIALCQLVWVAWYLLAPAESRIVWALPIMILEMLVPAYAERGTPTPWHRHHIIERYGLLVIIVLGEALLSSANAISAISKTAFDNADIWVTLAACFVIQFAMWWIYFGERQHAALNALSSTFLWGYAHYFIFASMAAVGAGIAILFDQMTHHAEISRAIANAAIAVPLAIYLLAVWLAHDRAAHGGSHSLLQLPLFAVLVLLTPFIGQGTLLAALLLIACITWRTLKDSRT